MDVSSSIEARLRYNACRSVQVEQKERALTHDAPAATAVDQWHALLG